MSRETRASSARSHACGVGSAGLLVIQQVKRPTVKQEANIKALVRFE